MKNLVHAQKFSIATGKNLKKPKNDIVFSSPQSTKYHTKTPLKLSPSAVIFLSKTSNSSCFLSFLWLKIFQTV